MRSILAGMVLIACAFIPAHAQPGDREREDFIGVWKNVEGQGRRITRIDIRPDYENRVRIEVWGDCGGDECSYGATTGRIFVNRSYEAREEDRAAILFKFQRERVAGNVLIRFERNGNIVTHALISTGSGADNYRVERFERAEGNEMGEDARRGEDYARREPRGYEENR